MYNVNLKIMITISLSSTLESPKMFYLFSISRIYRRKAVAKDWFGNSEQVSVHGKLEFIQQTEYDITDVEVMLEGLDGRAGAYDIHMV